MLTLLVRLLLVLRSVLPLRLLLSLLLLVPDAFLVFVGGVVGFTAGLLIGLSARLVLVAGLAASTGSGLTGGDRVFGFLVDAHRVRGRAGRAQLVALDLQADAEIDAHATLVGEGFEATRLNLGGLGDEVEGGTQLRHALVGLPLTHESGAAVVVRDPALDADLRPRHLAFVARLGDVVFLRLPVAQGRARPEREADQVRGDAQHDDEDRDGVPQRAQRTGVALDLLLTRRGLGELRTNGRVDGIDLGRTKGEEVCFGLRVFRWHGSSSTVGRAAPAWHPPTRGEPQEGVRKAR